MGGSQRAVCSQDIYCGFWIYVLVISAMPYSACIATSRPIPVKNAKEGFCGCMKEYIMNKKLPDNALTFDKHKTMYVCMQLNQKGTRKGDQFYISADAKQRSLMLRNQDFSFDTTGEAGSSRGMPRVIHNNDDDENEVRINRFLNALPVAKKKRRAVAQRKRK